MNLQFEQQIERLIEYSRDSTNGVKQFGVLSVVHTAVESVVCLVFVNTLSDCKSFVDCRQSTCIPIWTLEIQLSLRQLNEISWQKSLRLAGSSVPKRFTDSKIQDWACLNCGITERVGVCHRTLFKQSKHRFGKAWSDCSFASIVRVCHQQVCLDTRVS